MLEYKIVDNKLIRVGSDFIDKGSTACEVVDDGNGLSVVFDNRRICLDYYEAIEIVVMLLQNIDSSIELVKSKTIKRI
jgi:hypothetical protein